MLPRTRRCRFDFAHAAVSVTSHITRGSKQREASMGHYPQRRTAVAELRNEGYVEEQVRGVVRLTPRGYQVYRSKPLPAA